VVIGYLDVSRAIFIFRPFEADSVLFVDADAELSRSIAAQSFESVTWQGSQILKSGRRVQYLKSFVGLSSEPLESFNELAFGKITRPLIWICLNHFIWNMSCHA